ncbi:MAG: lysine--tRNA ligase [Eisenbergiella sp.]
MADAQNKNTNDQQELNQILKVRREKLAALQEAGKDPFVHVKYDVTAHSADVREKFEELEGQTVSIAGRIMFKRVMGKASFCNIQDLKGSIQVYVARDSIGEEPYADFKKYDVGDIVGVKGEVFTTKTGEISVHAAEVVLLSKSLQVLPEKYHGLTNTDLRYRQRYVDLIMNQDVKDTFIKRSRIISAVRRYLDGEGFMEVETPMLVANAGGAAARPFETHYNALDEDVKLRISLELYLKRLIVGGMERVYEIGRVFRNEGVDTRHNPEFTLMELYQAYTDYHGMMDLSENLYRFVAQEVLGTTEITYGEHTIDLGKPFERITMLDAVKKYAGVDFNEIHSDEEAKAIAKEHHIEFEERHKKGDILSLFFEEYAEPHMIQPTFVMDHPVEISPLTKRKPENPDYVERFELFMNGWEMANAYSELNDPIDQRARFKAQEELLSQGDEEANTTDEDFMNALEIGMPPTGGIGFGIDRMVMLLTNSPAIRDVLLFPTMKTLDPKKAENKAEKAAVNGSAEDATVSAPSVQIDLSKVKIEPLFADDVDFETFSKSDFRVVKIEACEAVPKSKKLLKFTLNDGTDRKRTILSGIHEYYEPEELVGKTCVAITNLPPRKMMGIDSEGMLISAVYEYDGREGLNLLMLDDSIPAGAKLY